MKQVHYTLVSDGPFDRALMPILHWTLRQYLGSCPINSEWADLRRLPVPPSSLSDRIKKAVELYPCELLFIHRDAERMRLENRRREVKEAVSIASTSTSGPGTIPVIPVRMTEAWLLIDEEAIRKAAGNPSGTEVLPMPKLAELERIPDPKMVLYGILRVASGLSGRRRKRFPVDSAACRISEFISDFSPLRGLGAFRQLEEDIHCWSRGIQGGA